MTTPVGDTVFLNIRYKQEDQPILLGRMEDLGFGQDMRLQFSELMFVPDDKNPEFTKFMLAIPGNAQSDIKQAFANQNNEFDVTFTAPPAYNLTPAQAKAARERLEAKGFTFG